MSTIDLQPPALEPDPVSAPAAAPAARTRRTPLAARGEPMVWLMGAGLLACLTLILGLLGLIFAQGLSTFWPRPVELITLRSGEVLMGVPVKDEFFEASAPINAEVEALRDAGELAAGAIGPDGVVARRLYRVGNRELGQQPFRWVPLYQIQAIERPAHATLLERREWGVWLGMPAALVVQDLRRLPPEGEFVADEVVLAPAGQNRITREVVGAESDGSRLVRERTYIAEGAEATAQAFAALHRESMLRRAQIETIMRHDMGDVNRRMDAWRLRVREAELALRDAQSRRRTPLSTSAWSGLLAATGLCIGGGIFLGRRASRIAPRGLSRARTTIALTAIWSVAGAGTLAVALEHPWQTAATPEYVQSVREQAAAGMVELQAQYDALLARSGLIAEQDARYRVLFVEPASGRFAPTRQTEPEEPMLLSQIVRAVAPNDLSILGKLGIYFDRWREFLTSDPREANTEGGVFPVIFGTVVLTILLSIAVVPLGVIAALYLREYARQGLVTSILRIAVNNLAGVPSIVYGMFGVIFFRYTLGAYIDAGPAQPAAVFPWWLTVGGFVLIVVGAVALAVFARPRPGTPPAAWQVWFGRTSAALWIASLVLVALLFANTPYFTGFFRANQPNPTFASPGLLWGALTLALLTLPVVIVATEEAIAAVPRTMREGSYGAGASKWQTIRRIVLPGAMPGIMTGMILAMARGAGEVAPLMLVGAVKLAPELPISGSFPFLHADRSFMHLGFHIFDLGFQSPDSEAARPLVWTTTLLLITIVVLLNLVAISIRGRLRARLRSQQF
jgi:phosphate transport system permease protein